MKGGWGYVWIAVAFLVGYQVGAVATARSMEGA